MVSITCLRPVPFFPTNSTSFLVANKKLMPATVQRVSDTAKGFAVRVAKVENTPLEDNEKTMAQLEERVQKTIAILEKAKVCFSLYPQS